MAEERPVKQVELDALLAAPEGFGDDVPDRSGLPRPATSRRGMAALGPVRGHRGGRPAPPPARGARARRFHALRGGDARHQRRVRDRRRARAARDRAGVVPRRREPWRGDVRAASRGRGAGAGSSAAGGQAAARRARRRARPLGGGPQEQAPVPRRALRAAAHPLAPPDPVARDALRLPGELDPRAHLRRSRPPSASASCSTPASPDAEGTLGGLVQQARHLEEHLAHALRMAALCSNDPICAQHAPGESMEERWLHGAACHGCALVAETSCEMRNDYLDRALVVPVLGVARCGVLSGADMIGCPARSAAAPARAPGDRARIGPSGRRTLCSGRAVRAWRSRRRPSESPARSPNWSGWACRGRRPRRGSAPSTKVESRAPRPDLVWSGPEVPGLHARDTRRVYEELLGSAERTLSG